MRDGREDEQRLGSLGQIVWEYGSLISWLAKDGARRFPVAVAVALGVAVISLLLQLNAIALAIYFAKSLAEGAAIQHFGWSIDLRSAPKLLVGAGVVVATLLALSGWVTYGSRVQGVALGRRYQEHCSERVLALCGSSDILRLREPVGEPQELLGMLRRGPLSCGLMFRNLLDLLPSLVTFAVAMGVLTWMNPWLTAAIGAAMLVALGFQIRTSRGMAKHARVMDELAGATARVFKRFVRWQLESPMPVQGDRGIRAATLENRDVGRWSEAFYGRLRVMATSELVNNTLLAAAVLLMFVVLGRQATGRGTGWDRPLVFLIALRYATAGMSQVTLQVTNLNRHYPRVKRYREVLESLESLAHVHSGRSGRGGGAEWIGSARPVRMVVTRPLAAGSAGEWTVLPGTRLGLMGPIELSRYRVVDLLCSLVDGDAAEACAGITAAGFVDTRQAGPVVPLRQVLEVCDRAAERWLGRKGGLWELWLASRSELGGETERPPTDAEWSAVQPVHKVLVGLLLVLETGCPWMVVTDRALSKLPATAREQLMAVLADRILVVAGNDTTTSVGSYGEDAVLVVSGTGETGIFEAADFKARRQEVQERVRWMAGDDRDASATLDAAEGDDEDLV